MNQKEAGKKIRAARERRGLTQKQLADATGIHERTLRNYETGSTRPSGVFARALEEALGVNLSSEVIS